MKTVFKKGMTVYDQVFFGKTPLKITEVKADMSLRVLYGEVTYCYTGDGRFIGDDITSNRWRPLSHTPTLSTSPYTLQGFEQKESVSTFEEAVDWLEKNSKDRVIYADEAYINEEYELAFEALKKLTILRDYYNEGCNFESLDAEYCAIVVGVIEEKYGYEIVVRYVKNSQRVLFFKSKEIANKFLEEQRELLETAKPLL